MAKYSRGGVIVVAALCLGGILFPLTSSAPTTSPSVSSDAVSEQTGTKQIAVDNKLCLETGIRVVKAKGNNAVDAAVATLLCLGVVNFQSSGIGGGMVMVVAKKNPNGGQPNVTVIDARVVAPQSVNDPAGVPYVDDETLALIGPSSIAVPGELRGMKRALEMFSTDTVEKRTALFKDAISFAENGFQPSDHLLKAIKSAVTDPPASSRDHSFHNQQSATWFQGLKSLLQVNGEYIENTTNITRPRLAQTLRTIAANGFDEFYTGTVATNLVNDINNVCSTGPYFCRRLHNIISTQELRNYLVRERNSFKFLYDGRSGYKVYTAPAPYGGPALRIFLGIVADKVNRNSEEHNVYHYITEAAKFAASYRMKLGDPDFNSTANVTPAMAEADVQKILSKLTDDQARSPTNLDYYDFRTGKPADGLGTTHLSVITPDMAVSVTSSINDFFGSGFLSSSTGVLLNNDMDGFSLDGRFPLNMIQAGKRPLSAMCPTVVVDRNGDFKLVTGAAGGTRIPPAVGQTMFFTLTRNSTAKSASCKPRVYADLRNYGMSSAFIFQQVEKCDNSTIPGVGFPSNSKTLKLLKEDHNQPDYEAYTALSVVQSILKNGAIIDAHSDVRKFGGDCNWGFHTNVKLLLIVISFVLQYICIYM